jgi:hypothetical protein
MPELKLSLEKLEGRGSAILPSEQALQFQRVVQEQASRSNIGISSYDPGNRTKESTNIYFEEQTLTINIQQAGEEELVDFLYNLGTGSSMIRVRDLTIKPDMTGTRLQCHAVLVASYQKSKKSELKPSAVPAATKQPNRKP